MYTFFSGKKMLRLYALLGVNTIYIRAPHKRYQTSRAHLSQPFNDQQARQSSLSQLVPDDKVGSLALGVGAGVGLELHFTKHFSMTIELPLSAMFFIDQDSTHFDSLREINFLPIPGYAISFYH